MTILLTGGGGYIGSHTAAACIAAGHSVVLADNFSNSRPNVPERLRAVTGAEVPCYPIDIADRAALRRVFEEHPIDGVIHCAGLKAVGESVNTPLRYYRSNLDSTLTLLETMAEFRCSRLVFTSSATVYGTEAPSPLTETQTCGCIASPYGRTKYFIEEILQDAVRADPGLSAALLRCFNPAGAHSSGLLGEQPGGVPGNLMPYITQTAAGLRRQVAVFGGDYPTPDGTCVRDYVHVMDLAQGVAAALQYTESHRGAEVFNLGAGTGYSVLELIRTFEAVNQVTVPYVIAPRRTGDAACCVASVEKAARILHWKPQKTLADICRDAWRWQQTCGAETI